MFVLRLIGLIVLFRLPDVGDGVFSSVPFEIYVLTWANMPYPESPAKITKHLWGLYEEAGVSKVKKASFKGAAAWGNGLKQGEAEG